MAFPQNVVKLTWGGTMAAGEEIWSCGLYLHASIGDGDNYTPEQWAAVGELFPAYSAAIQQMHTDADTRIPAGVRLEWAKLALLGPDGKYLEEAHDYFYASPVSGGLSNAGYVPQVACVVTLVSEKYRDPGKYNRFYLPTGVPSTSAYKLSAAQTLGIAESAAPFIEALDTTYEWDEGETNLVSSIRPCVASKSYSELLLVKKIRVGDVLDTQRRRRNKIYETYTEQETDIA